MIKDYCQQNLNCSKEVLISKVLIDSNISHNEFVLINNKLLKFYDMKEENNNTNDT